MTTTLRFTVKRATSPRDLTAVKSLFTDYASSLGIDLSFQNFTAELDSLPGLYAPPFGAIFLALASDSEAIGCVGLRPLPKKPKPKPYASREAVEDGVGYGTQNKICEMKRLYCTPSSRGLGVGKALIEEVVGEAVRLGYEEMRLDTLPSMEGARKLYGKYGFEEMEAYYETPLEGTFFLRKKLGRHKRK
jgi:ribosomal protein S18 acetylase RimI-like enzyme